MTHLMEISENSLSLIKSGEQTFDLVNTHKPITVGDTIVFQTIPELPEDDEDIRHEFEHQELSVTVTFIYPSNGELKKGWVAVGFKTKED